MAKVKAKQIVSRCLKVGFIWVQAPLPPGVPTSETPGQWSIQTALPRPLSAELWAQIDEHFLDVRDELLRRGLMTPVCTGNDGALARA